MKINLKGVQTGFTAIPAGEYSAVVSKVDTINAEQSGSGYPYLKFEFTVNEGEFSGRKLWRNFSLKDNALWALKQAAGRMGVNEDILESDDLDTEEIVDAVLQSECRISVSTRRYNNKDVNDVDEVLETSLW